MDPQSVIQRTFAAGELAPVLHARADHEKYLSGLKTCKNFLVLRHGGVANRPGFRFVGECKTTSSNVRLMRYVSENVNDSIVIEAGVGYLRFYQAGALVNVSGVAAWNGATNYVAGDLVVSGGVNYYCILAHINHVPPNATYWYALTGTIYEVPHSFTSTGLFNWVQSGTVITLTHKNHKPQELIYFGLTNWVLRDVVTEPDVEPPLNVAVVAGAAGPLTYRYLVTAASAESYEESEPSNVAVLVACAEPTPAAPNVLTWDAVIPPVPEPAEWYVYCDPYGNGSYGYIGTAVGDEKFNDTGFVPDFNVTPPLARPLFDSVNNYPHVAAYHQQRRFFAGLISDPEAVFGSRTGFPSNFGISSPLQDDDAISFRMVGNQHHPVRHMVGLKQLIVLTDGGEWTVGQPKQALSPSNIPADQETYVGAAPDVRPVVVGNSIIYLQSRASIVRDLRFDIEVEGFAGRDLTVFAAHLFDAHEIKRIDFAQAPQSIVWAVRDDGRLLGLTYLRDQDVWGWHRHETQGLFEDVAVIPEDLEDAVYVIVRRTIGGNNKRYIERLASREIVTFDTDAFFLDSGLSYSGAPATVFSGLGHLEGRVVGVVADGSVIYDGSAAGAQAATYTVTGGSITIPAAATNVHIGLQIQYPDFETLDLDAQGTAVRDKKKRVGSVTLIVDKSSRSFYAGPDTSNLTRFEISPLDPAGDEHTGLVEMAISATWEQQGRVFVRQTDPLPLTILGILPNAIVGG